MLDLDGIEGLLKDGAILDLDDDQLRARLDELFSTLEENDRQRSETLDEMLAQVDELILIADELDDEDNFCR